MNERTHFFIKIYISHTLFSMFLWCVRDEWRQGQTAILTQLLLLTIAALLPYLGWGCSTGSCWGPQPSVCKLALTLAFLSPTNSTAAGTCLYSFLTTTCFHLFFHWFTQVHLWLTARSRVNIQQFLFSSLGYIRHLSCLKLEGRPTYLHLSNWRVKIWIVHVTPCIQ